VAKLSAQGRKELPKSQFAVPSKAPGSGSYPIPDASHARNALSRVAANGTPAEKAAVRAKVHRSFPEIGHKGNGAGGHGHASGMEKAMSDHADKVHPRG
jgi:hypothetical protein